ncbi:MAG TPA: hypothetical protein DCP92_21960 [Nitrospiraceae bacterium]|nr:hypothetical protein [Nitrospiraceae bacterium]
MRSFKFAKMLCLVISGLFLGSGGISFAQCEENTGIAWDSRIQLSTGSAGAEVCDLRGSGKLTQAGKEYDFEIKGLSAKATASGKVYNLKNPDGVNGTYAAVGTCATAGEGATSR